MTRYGFSLANQQLPRFGGGAGQQIQQQPAAGLGDWRGFLEAEMADMEDYRGAMGNQSSYLAGRPESDAGRQPLGVGLEEWESRLQPPERPGAAVLQAEQSAIQHILDNWQAAQSGGWQPVDVARVAEAHPSWWQNQVTSWSPGGEMYNWTRNFRRQQARDKA